jgi:serine protease AprX
MAAGFLLLAVLQPLSLPPPPRLLADAVALVDVLVQGEGAAAAVAAAGGRPLVALPIVDGVVGRVPAGAVGRLRRDRPGVRAVLDADRPLHLQGVAPAPATAKAHLPAASSGARRRATAEPPPAAGRLAGTLTPPAAGRGVAGTQAPQGAGRGVAVAVLDTGIAASGDLAGRVVARADLSGERSFTDSYGHGTFMAGLVAGDGSGGGPAGTAPAADLVDLKVAGADGSTTLGQVLVAMQLAASSRERFGIRVLNLSLGAPADDPATAPLTEAVERLWAGGIAVVTAAGNQAGDLTAPGLDPYVVTVGALDPAGTAEPVPAWSGSGPDAAGRPKPDLLAPGVGLVGLRAPGSTIDLANPAARVGGSYFRGSGTSMATALVAGAAAAVAAAHADWGPDAVKAALVATARSPGAPPGPAGPAAGGTGGPGALDLGGALRVASVEPANGDLLPLRALGRPGAPPSAAAPGWRAGAFEGLRWGLAEGEVPATAGPAGRARLWPSDGWLSKGDRTLAVPQWLARSWAARNWAARNWGRTGS